MIYFKIKCALQLPGQEMKSSTSRLTDRNRYRRMEGSRLQSRDALHHDVDSVTLSPRSSGTDAAHMTRSPNPEWRKTMAVSLPIQLHCQCNLLDCLRPSVSRIMQNFADFQGTRWSLSIGLRRTHERREQIWITWYILGFSPLFL